MFSIFIFDLEFLKQLQSSDPLHAKRPLILLLVRFTVCIECCLPIGWRTFIWWKNPPKYSSILVRVAEWWKFLPASRNPKNNWCLSRIYGIRFGEKDCGLSTYKPWTEQAGDWVQFCRKRLRTLKLSQIFSTEIKKSKTYSGWCPFKGLSNGTTLMQIQSGRTVPLR